MFRIIKHLSFLTSSNEPLHSSRRFTNNIATNLQDTKFVDCENYRYGCSVVSNHANCPTAKPGAVAVDALLKNQFRTLCSASASQTRSIHVSLNKDGTAYINLFDLYGRPVKTLIVNNTQITLDCSQLTPWYLYTQGITRQYNTNTKDQHLIRDYFWGQATQCCLAPVASHSSAAVTLLSRFIDSSIQWLYRWLYVYNLEVRWL